MRASTVAIRIGLSSSLPACALLATLPPPVPLAAAERAEFGAAGLTAVVPDGLDYCGEGLQTTVRGVQTWVEAGEGPLVVGGVLSDTWAVPNCLGGQAYLWGLTGGAFLGYTPIRREHFTLGVEVAGGWVWGALGVPVAVSPGRKFWFYTEPRVLLQSLGVLQVPAGASLQWRRYVLDLEVGTYLGEGFSWDATPAGFPSPRWTAGGLKPSLQYLSVGLGYRI